jgi:hypothetical protein
MRPASKNRRLGYQPVEVTGHSFGGAALTGPFGPIIVQSLGSPGRSVQ